MTTTANLYNGGAANGSGVTFATDVFTFDISDMNAVVTAYNIANTTSYPIFNTVTDSFEQFVQFLMIYIKIQTLGLGLNTFNANIIATNATTSVWGTRGGLNSKTYTVAIPFSSNSEVWGDPDNVG